MSRRPAVLPALLLLGGALPFPVPVQVYGLRLVLGNFFIVKVLPHLVNVVIAGTPVAEGKGFFPVAHVHVFFAQPADERVFFLATLGALVTLFLVFPFLLLFFGVLFTVVFILIFVLALTSSTRGLLGGHVGNLEVFGSKNK